MKLRSLPAAFVVVFCFSISSARAPEKWVYLATNLLVDKNVDDAETLMKRASAAGYTHLLLHDSKFSRLGELDARYFKNIERMKRISAETRIEIVPAVFSIGYSNDLLSIDPNLVEGLPVKNLPMIVKDGVAHVDDPQPPKLPGGDFSDLKYWSWKDPNIVAENGAARLTNPDGKNARIVQNLEVKPFRQYHVSVRVKTQDFHGKPEVKALAEKKGQLNWEDLGVKSTQDWTVHHAVFNSFDTHEVALFFGVWGGTTGSLWWDDAKIEEVAFSNLIRRDGAPLTVTTADGKPLVEGRDFERLDDPKMGQHPWHGEFDTFHEPPLLKTKLPDGTKLLVSYFHAATIYEHQASICPSEPKTMDLLRDQAKRMHAAWGAKGYMMSHDEVRVLNWDKSCTDRHLTPGEILADNVKQCSGILREVNPGGRVYVWSDMFDPNHNAVNGPYYLVNGDLRGSWKGIDEDVIVLPWYFEKRAESLKFFAERGNKQVVAGYYDSKPARVAEWLSAAKAVPGSVIGVMYTTWQNKYGDLEKFSAAVDAAVK